MASDKVKLDKDVAKKLDEFRAAAVKASDDVVFRVFPQKILDLQKLIESSASPSSPFHVSHALMTTDVTVHPTPVPTSGEPEPKKRKLNAEDANGATGSLGVTSENDIRHARYTNLMVANKHIVKVHEEMKKECEELAELCDTVKLWINLSMPKIEDGDNFGVQIQEEVLSELHRSQESAFNLRDAARQDYLNRAKICSKIIKYPHLEDYALSLKEHDEKQLYNARQNLHDLRNIYAILTDILHKNITKIRTPKGNNASGLY